MKTFLPIWRFRGIMSKKFGGGKVIKACDVIVTNIWIVGI
jgi:hypothetical protein